MELLLAGLFVGGLVWFTGKVMHNREMARRKREHNARWGDKSTWL